MQNILVKIYQTDDLQALENLLVGEKNISELRQILLDEFLKVADYKNAHDWNKAVRVRVGDLVDGADFWYNLDGEILDIFKRKQAFAQEKQFALTHLKDSVLPFFGQINSKEKIENFWSDFFKS